MENGIIMIIIVDESETLEPVMRRRNRTYRRGSYDDLSIAIA